MNKDLVAATVYVEQESQKGMVIGRKGLALKALGTAARADIESFLGECHCSDVGKNALCIYLVCIYPTKRASSAGLALTALDLGGAARSDVQVHLCMPSIPT